MAVLAPVLLAFSAGFVSVAALEVKIGLLFPHDTLVDNLSILKDVAFSTTAGAVAVAVDRVERDQLLPGVNIRSF